MVRNDFRSTLAVAFNRAIVLNEIEAILGRKARQGAERLSDTQLRDLLRNASRGGQSLGGPG